MKLYNALHTFLYIQGLRIDRSLLVVCFILTDYMKTLGVIMVHYTLVARPNLSLFDDVCLIKDSKQL